MSSDLFAWKSMTADLKAKKKKQKFSEPKTNSDIESWIDRAKKEEINCSKDMSTSQDVSAREHSESLDVNQWLKKVTMAAEVASSDLVLDEFVDDDVSAVFQSVLKENLPYIELDSLQTEDTDMYPLEEKFDTVNEARSILNAWLNTKNDLIEGEEWGSQAMSFDSIDEREETAEDTVKRLRTLPIEKDVVANMRRKKKNYNPIVSMAVRQEKVKERREKLEQERASKLKASVERKQVRAQAEEIIKEEKIRKEREYKLEEEKIQNEMVVLRKRLQSEQIERMMNYEREKEQQTSYHNEKLAEEYRKIVRETAEQEYTRKRLLTTRHMLLRQLEEAEKKELKMRYKTLQETFTTWRESVLDQRVQNNRAIVHYTWKLQLCAWCKWKRYYRSKLAEHEDKVKVVLYEENKRWRMAQLHYQHRNVYMCFKAWLAWTRSKTEKRREKLEELKRKLKMEECLATAVKIARNTENVKGKEKYNCERYEKRKRKIFAPNFRNAPTNIEHVSDNVQTGVQHVSDNVQTDVQNNLVNVPSQNIQCPSVENITRLNEACVMRPNFDNLDKKKKKRSIQSEENNKRIEEDMEDNNVIKHVTGPDIPPVSSNPWDHAPHHQPTYPVHPSYQPSYPNSERSTATQKRVPAALKGMEERAQQRKIRQMEIEKRKEQKKVEELEKIRAEQDKKDDEERERKYIEKERKIHEAEERAKLEVQRQANIVLQRQNMAIALQYYHNKLLTRYGTIPLKALLSRNNTDNKQANKFRNIKCILSHFVLWKEEVMKKEKMKQMRADENYNRLILKNCYVSWKKAVSVQHTFTTLALRHYKRVYKMRVIRAWSCVVKEDRERRKELGGAAQDLYYRTALKNHFTSWVRLVPVLKRERERAGRRDLLRSKVAMMLPDYHPPSHDIP